MIAQEEIAGKQRPANPMLDTGPPGPHTDRRKEQFESARGQLTPHQLFTMAVGPQGIPLLSAAVKNSPVVTFFKKWQGFDSFGMSIASHPERLFCSSHPEVMWTIQSRARQFPSRADLSSLTSVTLANTRGKDYR